MSEPAPPPYLPTLFTCERCGRTVDLGPEEAEALEALARVGLPVPTLLCEVCRAESVA